MSENNSNRIVITEEKKVEAEEKTNLDDFLKEPVQIDLNLLNKLKEKMNKDKETKMETKDRSLNFGVVGLGQSGGRISEVLFELGYEACIFNTATQDMKYIKMPEGRKVFLPFALGGAGKELDNGRQAVEQNGELIINKLKESFSDKVDMLFLAVSGGGGTGSGGAESILGLMATIGKPIGVIYVLPMESEDVISKHNAITTLSKLSKMASSDVITPLIVVDNSKIELLYPNLSKAEFWKVANKAIVEPIHLFNILSATASNYESLDPMDFGKLITCGDCTIYGKMELDDYMESTAIAEAVIENLESNLLVSDFNLKDTRLGGFIVVGNKEILSKLPSVNINYASHMISELCDSPQLVSGVYEQEGDNCLKIYTMFSGLGLPTIKIEKLQKEVNEKMNIVKEKEKARVEKMSVEYGTGTESKAQEIHKAIGQKKSGFGKLTSNASKKVIDYRKR